MKVYLSFISLMLLMVAQQANSQIPVSDMKYSHGCSEAVTEELEAAPPYQWNMPLSVFQTYFALDSLCRTNLTSNYADLYNMFSNMITPAFADSISKYLYKAIDYDPLLFYKYIFQGQYLTASYINNPNLFYYLFNELRLNTDLGVNPFLAVSSGIYHIYVTSVALDTTYLSPTRSHPVLITCIEADVITTIKGEELTTSHVDPETGSDVAHISFSYANYWETAHKRGGNASDNDIIVESTDPDIIVHGGPPTYGTFHSPSVGDEYILFAFLHFEPHSSADGTVYNIWPCLGSQPEGGLFPIVNGNVADSSNYFGWGTSVTLTMFINNLMGYILNNLLN